MKTALLAGAAVLAGTCCAAAAEFYVVQDTSSKQCRVVEQKPTGSTLIVVGGESRTYATQGEAETAMKSESACNQTAQAPTAKQTAQAPKSANPPATTGAAPAGSNAQIMNDVPANTITVTNYYKQAIYDPQNNRIGDVDDVLMSPDGRVNALVIGVGGFLGIGEKHVIVPFNVVKAENKDNKVTLMINSSKDELKAAPGFKYDRSKTSWVKEAS
jgi:sporulation protein YlmC with PRC-barrel domain